MPCFTSSVATCLRYGWLYCNSFVGNLVLFPVIKNFKIGWSLTKFSPNFSSQFQGCSYFVHTVCLHCCISVESKSNRSCNRGVRPLRHCYAAHCAALRNNPSRRCKPSSRTETFRWPTAETDGLHMRTGSSLIR